MSFFSKAEKRKAWLKLGMTGPSGSGKTFSALKLAIGMGKGDPNWKVALIDTENHSASLYADKFQFLAGDIQPPYTIEKYLTAINEAVAADFDVLIIDSLSHAWAGEGGLLAKKEAMDARGGNSYANWAKITPEHEKFKAKILSSQIHMICTMRSKQDYILETNDKGKQAPRKVGLAPVQREGMEYELTTVFDLAMDHQASISKDRTSLFDNQIFTITEQTGLSLMQWLDGGKGELVRAQVQPTQQTPRPTSPPPDPQLENLRKRLFVVGAKCGYQDMEIKKLALEHFPHIKSRKDLKALDIQTLIQIMEGNKKPTVGSREDIASAANEPPPPEPPWEEDFPPDHGPHAA